MRPSNCHEPGLSFPELSAPSGSSKSIREEVNDMTKSSGKPSKGALSKAGKTLASNGTSKGAKSKAGKTLGKG